MAVFTHIPAEQAAAHLAAFDIGTLKSLTPIGAGVENTNYRLSTTQGDYVLTLVERRTPPEALPFVVAFMAHLQKRGIPCPAVIADKNGETILPLAGRPAILTAFLSGATPARVETPHAAAAGELLAEMHKAAAGFRMQRENPVALPAWKKLIGACKTAPVYGLLRDELAWLEKNRPWGLPAGAVHADLFPDNAFFKDGQISGVFDFYFSCTDAYAYDFMATLGAWCFDDGIFAPERERAFSAAYQKIRPLSQDEKKSLPYFGRAAALRIVATRLYDQLHPAAGAVISPHDPFEHVRILQFHQSERFSC
ncbi:MAG: homoserine kinase [Alphaproteobacteria bacterium]|nr:homoserine kinase [Alphaproteobacteria bacterium]MDE2336822.1 homoserine kinase [Alphaproteobacteria bacterium]